MSSKFARRYLLWSQQVGEQEIVLWEIRGWGNSAIRIDRGSCGRIRSRKCNWGTWLDDPEDIILISLEETDGDESGRVGDDEIESDKIANENVVSAKDDLGCEDDGVDELRVALIDFLDISIDITIEIRSGFVKSLSDLLPMKLVEIKSTERDEKRSNDVLLNGPKEAILMNTLEIELLSSSQLTVIDHG